MKATAAETTFGELAKRYARTVLAARKGKPATRTYYRSSLRMVQRIWTGLPETPVQSITPRACRRWFEVRSRMVVASRANAELSMLKGVLDLAQRERLIAVNPAASIAGHKFEQGLGPYIPTPAQFTKLVLIARHRSQRRTLESLLLFAYSGLRRHEAAGLTWNDIDFKRGNFIVTTLQPGTSERRIRYIPLFPNLRRHLLWIRSHRPQAKREDRVLPSKAHKNYFSKACRNARIPQLTSTTLRHFFAVTALQAGVDYPLLSQWLGHKDGGLRLLKMYGRYRQQDPKQMAAHMTFAV
jgi:integrase